MHYSGLLLFVRYCSDGIGKPTKRRQGLDKESLTDYIKWLLTELDGIQSDVIDKETVRIMILSIIGEMYRN